jgi:hypothetical protein
MSLILPVAESIARMVSQGAEYEDTGLPGIFKTTKERLAGKNLGASPVGAQHCDDNIRLDIRLDMSRE